MPDWNVIISGPSGHVTFTPDVPGAKPGDPLQAQVNDLVSWENQTKEEHQIEITGAIITEPIDAGDSSTPAYLVPSAVGSTITYNCLNHPDETGTIAVFQVTAPTISNITITGPAGQVTFKKNPLTASAGSSVTWTNNTNDNHQIAVDGAAVTQSMGPTEQSTPPYAVEGSSGSTITYSCLNHPSESGTITISVMAFFLMLAMFAVPPLRAQTPAPAPAPASTVPVGTAPPNSLPCGPILGQPFANPPEIGGSSGVVRGIFATVAEQQLMAFPRGVYVAGPLKNNVNIDCFPQWVRAYRPGVPPAMPPSSVTNPQPGPTIRAHVGDLIELTFLNQILKSKFPKADLGRCSQTTVYPGPPPGGDRYPDCFNESIITNVHFHGTHTNPNSTGDNVFLQIMPSPREADGTPVVTAAKVAVPFGEFFKRCEAELGQPSSPKQWPRIWADFPQSLRDKEDEWLKQYAPEWYHQNLMAIAQGAWPQNYIGAYPYCYRLPVYPSTTWPPAPPAVTMSAHTAGAGSAEMDESQQPKRPLIMGQAPGTQWYHAHKHGSTTLNVANGMTGLLIVEGDYDLHIKQGYAGKITQQLLVINQLGVQSNLERGGPPAGTSPGGPYFSVNGVLQPVLTMAPGEVQWWRIANTSSRAAAYFLSPSELKWKQLAQDGVQFSNANYTASWNASQPLYVAPGNRVDLLVQAPATPSSTCCSVLVNNVVDPTGFPGTVPLTLLTVKVTGAAKPMSFLPDAAAFPPFLADIKADEVTGTKTLVFASTTLPAKGTPINQAPAQHTIDGKKFDGEVGAVVLLNRTEEWKIVNETYAPNQVAHPFHIHINPFQVTEVFAPNAIVLTANGRPVLDSNGKTIPVYITSGTPGKGQCLIDLNDRSTWKPCPQVTPPVDVWFDVYPIPSGKQFSTAPNQVNVPGYFKMRSRFVDFFGYYVLHCHILAHEDRGMMTVVEVSPLQPPFSHH